MRELTQIELGEVNGGALWVYVAALGGVVAALKTLDETSQEFFDGAADAWYGNPPG